MICSSKSKQIQPENVSTSRHIMKILIFNEYASARRHVRTSPLLKPLLICIANYVEIPFLKNNWENQILAPYTKHTVKPQCR